MKDNNKNTTALLIAAGLVVIVAIGVLAYVFMMDKPVQTNTSSNDAKGPSTAVEESQKPDASTSEEGSSTVITFTDSGFSPTSYTTTKGSTVTVKNESEMDVQFSSADYPTHTEQSELNMDVLAAGESGTFTVTKTGTFGFHDHINDQFTGTLTVE